MHTATCIAIFLLMRIMSTKSDSNNCPKLNCDKKCSDESRKTDRFGCMTCSCSETLGDLRLTEQQLAWIERQELDLPAPRAVSSVVAKWTNDVTEDGCYRIPYYYSADIENRAEHKKNINKAISIFNAITCLDFQPATVGDIDRIQFIVGGGCWSYVGRTGGNQEISIGDGCQNVAVIMHEILHALGFWHEQSRPDRDNYVTILFDNILNGKETNFFKKTVGDIESFSSPYDYKSVLHYSSHAFSKNGNPTIINAVTSEPVDSQRIMLSEEDIHQVLALYNCNGKRQVPITYDCMHPLDRGASYRGSLSVTKNGKTCQKWNEQSPHTHVYDPSHVTGGGLEENFCRNPDIDDRPWCYTTDPDQKWEFCDVPICDDPVPEVDHPKAPTVIRGFWSEWSGWSQCDVTCGSGFVYRTRQCIGENPEPSACPGSAWESKACDASNICADNWLNWRAWSACDALCSQGNSGHRHRIRKCRTEYCGVDVFESKACSLSNCLTYPGGDCHNLRNRKAYRGNISITDKKEICLPWDKVTAIDTSQYPNTALEENYCRNPKGFKWQYCYVENRLGKQRRRNCKHSVPQCQNKRAKWSAFTAWSGCSASCGGGFKYRTRFCRGGSFSEGRCIGNVIQRQECNKQDCESGIGIPPPPSTIVPPTIPSTGNPSCAVLGDPQSYRGTIAKTYDGDECQYWNAYPNSHNYRTVDKFVEAGLSENYCRAPESDNEWPWCYTKEGFGTTKICDVPMCDPDPPLPISKKECYDSNNRQAYRGQISVTSGGIECQRWDLNTPHAHISYKPFRYPDQGLGPHNYCRNPDNDLKPWCLTTDPNRYWDFCDIPEC
ncbi:plasminogen-like isoform X2 [Clavelina lepadiformis]|uniref:plasminogen-like isoform X2 n=1 Tax=Clavelina lepadiformis TaxID=159417 RepID=UPI0040412D35